MSRTTARLPGHGTTDRTLVLDLHPNLPWVDHRIADLTVRARPCLPVGPSRSGRSSWTPRHSDDQGDPRAADGIFSGPVRMGSTLIHLTCRHGDRGYRLELGGDTGFAVARRARGTVVCSVSGAAPRVPSWIHYGPLVLLGLALENVFCLHASACLVDGRLIAFVGPSGAGKSTLARHLHGPHGGSTRVADDLLPVRLGPDGLEAAPHFPQPALAPTEQYPRAAAPRLDLGALFVLRGSASGVWHEEISGARAVAHLTAHVAGTALFAPQLRRRLFDATCTALAGGGVKVVELRYPHDRSRLPEVGALVRAVARGCRPIRPALEPRR